MSQIIDLSIKAKYYKSIGAHEQGFESIYPINIIIGRNNTGKSALLDLIKYSISIEGFYANGHKNNTPELLLTKPLSEQEIISTFPSNRSGGSIQLNHQQYGMQWLNKPLTIRQTNETKQFVSTIPSMDAGGEYHNQLAHNFQNNFQGKKFRCIKADRDVNPESDGHVDVKENGQGTTNIIQIFYNNADRNRTLVTTTLLQALNTIFNPDINFDEIVVRRNRDGLYEIYLSEENKGLIALSNSGSGLKTVFLVLVNLLLVPEYEEEPLSKYVFAFEELENNLHPGLQRRLFNFIRKIAVEQNTYFFLTTHSNVVIDLFNRDEKSQIVHITHNGEVSMVNKVITYIENKGILDDLDIRASDLLQSNGIIWVEGPSDRLYLNQWIKLWSDSTLKEGTHYQCVFYGGRLLAHLSALEDEEEEQNGVSLMKVNKNAILLMDSDKNNEKDLINKTKQRLIEEIESVEGYSWITAGREVENYIPMEALNTTYNSTDFTEINPFDKFEDYMENRKAGEGNKYLRNKVLFAEKIIPNLTKENVEPIYDLNKRLTEICEVIKSWNAIHT